MNEERNWEALVERELLDEELTTEQRRELEAHAASDPLLAAEYDVLRRLSTLDEVRDEAREQAVAEQALAALGGGRTAVATERSGNVVRLRWVFAGAVAAAAAAALFVSTRDHAGPVAGVPTRPAATFVRAEGAIVVDGVPSEHPLPAMEGASVELVQGTACLELSPRIFACLGEGSRVRVSELDAPRKRLDLLEGRVVVALDPQPADRRFSVVAAGVWSTAVGTMFSVEVNDDGVVQTAVYEGKVLVGGENDGDLVVAHKIGLAAGDHVDIEDLEAADASKEWADLEGVSGKTAPDFEPPAAVEPSEPEEPEATPEPSSAKRTVAVEQTAPAEPTASDLLASARTQRAAGQWSEAATTYRQILAGHPASPEARAVLVSLAGLELRQLGQPAAALEHFDAYLAGGGGALSIEAELGRVHALRRLGDVGRELSAIDAFLAAHPNNLEAPALQKRRTEIAPN